MMIDFRSLGLIFLNFSLTSVIIDDFDPFFIVDYLFQISASLCKSHFRDALIPQMIVIGPREILYQIDSLILHPQLARLHLLDLRLVQALRPF